MEVWSEILPSPCILQFVVFHLKVLRKVFQKRTLCSEETFSNLTRMSAACFPKEPRQAGRDLELKASGGELQVDCRLISSSYHLISGACRINQIALRILEGSNVKKRCGLSVGKLNQIYSAHT